MTRDTAVISGGEAPEVLAAAVQVWCDAGHGSDLGV
jgi:hypothetical protein